MLKAPLSTEAYWALQEYQNANRARQALIEKGFGEQEIEMELGKIIPEIKAAIRKRGLKYFLIGLGLVILYFGIISVIKVISGKLFVIFIVGLLVGSYGLVYMVFAPGYQADSVLD